MNSNDFNQSNQLDIYKKKQQQQRREEKKNILFVLYYLFSIAIATAAVTALNLVRYSKLIEVELYCSLHQQQQQQCKIAVCTREKKTVLKNEKSV